MPQSLLAAVIWPHDDDAVHAPNPLPGARLADDLTVG